MQLPPHIRAYIYRIVTAVFATLIVYGVVGPGDAAVWFELVAAVLGLGTAGLAAVNTSTDH